MPIFNVEEYLEESINSLLEQTLNFKENIQLIIIDDGSSDNSKEIALKYQKVYPDNIIVISKENGGVASARNLGLEYASGDYINFMDSDDLFSQDTFKKAYDFFLKYPNDDYDFVSIPVFYFEAKNFEHHMNYKFHESESDFVDLTEHPEFYQNLCFTFIKKQAIKDFRFETNLKHMEDSVFINKILLEKMKYGLVKDGCYFYRKTFNSTSLTGTAKTNKDYYLKRLKYGHLGLIEYSIDKLGYVPHFIQNVILYDFRWILNTPMEVIKEVLNTEEFEEFINYIKEILSYFDDSTILNHRPNPKYISQFLIYIKNNNEFHIETKGRQVLLKSGDTTLSKLNTHKIWLDIIEFKNGFLYISGSFSSICDNRFIYVEAIKSNSGKKETFKAKQYEYKNPSRKTLEIFSIPWRFVYSFDLKIPLEKDETSNITFKLVYDENNEKIRMNGHVKFKSYANLSEENPYFIKDSHIILFRDQKLYIENYTFIRFLKNEFKTLRNIYDSHDENAFVSIMYRFSHLLLYPFYKNRDIWLFMDRPSQSGDNAEHFFNYAIQQNDDIGKYFLITKDSQDYKRLKKQYGRKIVAVDSIRHKLLYLFCKKMISSHVNYENLNPFIKINLNFFTGLDTSELYFLQHGVPKYEMSSWLRKYDHNVSLIVAVSDFDYNSYQKYYNYEKDIIQILGYPRYDNLTNENKKKQIVIMFSWRKFIENENILLESEYYKRINSLINNDELVRYAKDNGYEIIFKMHPAMSIYTHLFSANPYIKIDETTSFHELICDSALLITDYSSIAFDFAYLEKPVIYYQYGNDYHFDTETNYFDEKSGIGEIIDNESMLVNKINHYLKNECVIEDKFKENVHKFFKFHDKNNSKRIYDWIRNH